MTTNTPASEVPWTKGPWEVRACLNLDYDYRDPTKIESVVYEIVAGDKAGPFQNEGFFHPSNAVYYTHQHYVVDAVCDDGYRGGIKKEADARLIAESPTMAALLEEMVNDSECYCCDEGVAAKGPCGWHKATEILSRIKGKA